MTIDQILQAFILITGIVGQILVAHQNRKGFYWFIACNIAAILVSVWSHLYGMALLYLFYAGMSIYSIEKWKTISTKVATV